MEPGTAAAPRGAAFEPFSPSPSLEADQEAGTEQDGLHRLVVQHRNIERAFAGLARTPGSAWEKKKQLIYLRKMICAHENVEALVLAPLVRSRIPNNGGDLWRSSRPLYHAIERLLVEVDRRSISSPDLPELLEDVGVATSALILHQEYLTFPQLRSALDPGELEHLDHRLVRVHGHATSHPHPLLPHRGPLAYRARAMMAVLDRLRDRTTPRV